MSVRSGQFNYDAVARESPVGFTKITEGTTAVLEPPPKKKTCTSSAAPAPASNLSDEEADNQLVDQAVFYNPAQVVNRDLSISVIEVFSRLRLTEPRRRGGTNEGITILEALSATGLRAIRYYKEITNVRYIIANDMDADAVDCIVRNCAYNGVPVQYPTLMANMPAAAIELYAGEAEAEKGESATGASPRVGVRAGGAILPNLDDANDLMFRLAMNSNAHPGKRVCLVDAPAETSATASLRPLLQQELMDVVDLDPYGSASPFLDGAFRCIKEGGLMLVTSTDSAILCGNFADTAHAKYSSMPYKAAHCHEAAVRTLLACVERVANRHQKFIVPLLSLHIDFYVRCFFRVYKQPAETKLSACKLGYQLQCSSCSAFWVRPMATARQPRPSRQERRRQRRALAGRVNSDADEAEEEGKTAEGAAEASRAHARPRRLSKRVRDGSDDDEAVAHDVDGVRTEVYPASPSRHSHPKITPLTLQQMPSAASATSTTAATACPVCGSSIVLSGPLYAAPTQNCEFLQQLLALLHERASEGRLNAEARITGLVRIALEELPDCPLFYLLPDVASYVRVRCPPTPCIVGALARLGYRCSQVHCAAAGLKTDCPPEVLFRVMLQWKTVQDTLDPVGEATIEDGADKSKKKAPAASTAPRSLLVTPLAEADFTYDKAHDFRGRVTGVAKFVPNASGWGPRRRHRGAAAVPEAVECGNGEDNDGGSGEA
ncbi:putative N(2), N(2)-dimethylguanosine tRNA methyltransferase [Leishmania major strain Friedlin]|uniref:tRNA (guanine(26)-N(2))-dimethyltransferase n=1 Tax=Leishmania major TaxID=5664 RepID=Q4QG60_LEIMA|nr:putative N(2), N(2)-dimethylguanosine tRNA methyltransferase [Leishmania major strain Friedlin]CAG9571041.1 N(2)_-_N(2)-dimethylguanosine_tRNA_methyltransferase_-_putative [Leishmania major strain Friedlin]CAJ02863.1 putative N(2), N(2)-dimethylguanosine tRNA methyltransferase [Leishmania major strain Friedlin]|eukprot:XP_001681838.1 putative N(2), N(2)-dimethylguanosine tRNA methyltransferase [Leishmania major strain Friedlin]